MSIGNLKDNGNKGNNYPYQLASLQLLEAILNAVVATGGPDREFRITTYKALVNGVGYSIGDFISRTDNIDVATGTVISTLWFNETTGLTLAPPPPIIDLTPYTPPLSLPTVIRTPGLTRVTGVGSILAGARSVSVFNSGVANGVIIGQSIRPGETLTWTAGGQSDTLSVMTYDGTGTELTIITVL